MYLNEVFSKRNKHWKIFYSFVGEPQLVLKNEKMYLCSFWIVNLSEKK